MLAVVALRSPSDLVTGDDEKPAHGLHDVVSPPSSSSSVALIKDAKGWKSERLMIRELMILILSQGQHNP